MAREITIDSSGRVVIPMDVRQRHHLSAGSRLILVDDEERLVLIPRQGQTTTLEKAGLLVFQGQLAPGFPDHRAVRDERLSSLAGLP